MYYKLSRHVQGLGGELSLGTPAFPKLIIEILSTFNNALH